MKKQHQTIVSLVALRAAPVASLLRRRPVPQVGRRPTARKVRTLLLGVGLIAAASLTVSPSPTLAGVSSGSGPCADTTPLMYLPASGTTRTPNADASTISALAAYKAQHDTQLPATAAAKAAEAAASAQKLARIRGLEQATNVSRFASRSAAVNACGGVPASSSLASKVGQAFRSVATDAYACASNSVCSPGFAYVQWLNHQDEGGNGTWCGPATVSMIALTEPGPSWVDQQTARDYITNYQGQAVEDVGSSAPAVRSALNVYVAEPNLGWDFYYQVSLSYYPTSQERSDYHYRLVSDIQYAGYAVAGNTWEVAGAQNPHLPGHPTTFDIFHYIEIGGYDEGDGWDYFSDSATGVPGWGVNVPAYSWYSEYDLVTILGGRGYIW